MIAWVLFVTEMVSVLLRPEGMFAVGIGVLFVILEVWLYLLVAGILDERFPEAELSICLLYTSCAHADHSRKDHCHPHPEPVVVRHRL